MDKVKNVSEIAKLVEELKDRNKKIVTTNGVFDILHIGHVRYLQKAKTMGSILIVGVNSDASVKRIKGPKRPLNNENDRAEVLASLSCVDYVVIFNEDSPIKLLETIKPDVHAKGGDYMISQILEKDAVENSGGKIVLIKMQKGYSTTALINKIEKN